MKKKKSSEIIVNDKDTFLCNRIVAFGDSMVEGAELLDHTLPIGNLKKKMSVYEWSDLIREKNLIDQHEKNKEETKKLSYPAQLAYLMRKNFINYGVGGNSLECVCWQMLHYYVPDPTDLVLIGLPPVERLWKFSRPDSFDGNVLIGWPHSYGGFDDSLLDWYSEPRLLWEYIKCLCLIRDYKKSVHPHVYVIPQWHSLESIIGNIPKVWKSSLGNTIAQLYKSDLFLFHRHLCIFPWMTTLEHGHPTLSAQIRIATHINKHHIKLL